jgi:hypothetical protein
VGEEVWIWRKAVQLFSGAEEEERKAPGARKMQVLAQVQLARLLEAQLPPGPPHTYSVVSTP